MKIKISTRYDRDINIQNIKYTYNEFQKPYIYFDCPMKYENTFDRVEVIFHDIRGKELFRSKISRLDYLYYEEDSKRPKVRFVARDLEIEDLGAISQKYLCKILKKACNAKIVGLIEPQPPPPIITKPKRLHRSYCEFLIFSNRCLEYIMHRRLYLKKNTIFTSKIFNTFHVQKRIESTAPT